MQSRTANNSDPARLVGEPLRAVEALLIAGGILEALEALHGLGSSTAI